MDLHLLLCLVVCPSTVHTYILMRSLLKQCPLGSVLSPAWCPFYSFGSWVIWLSVSFHPTFDWSPPKYKLILMLCNKIPQSDREPGLLFTMLFSLHNLKKFYVNKIEMICQHYSDTKPDKDTTKENQASIPDQSLMQTSLSKYYKFKISNTLKQYYTTIRLHLRRCLNIDTINVDYHRTKIDMIISIDAETTNKIQINSLDKKLSTVGIDG